MAIESREPAFAQVESLSLTSGVLSEDERQANGFDFQCLARVFGYVPDADQLIVRQAEGLVAPHVRRDFADDIQHGHEVPAAHILRRQRFGKRGIGVRGLFSG